MTDQFDSSQEFGGQTPPPSQQFDDLSQPQQPYGGQQQGMPPQDPYNQAPGATPYGQHPTPYGQPAPDNKRVLAGILGILLGSLGVHKFILGYTTEGIIMAAVSILTCGFGAIIMSPIGMVEGIIYLTKSEEEFYQTYQVGQKGWF